MRSFSRAPAVLLIGLVLGGSSPVAGQTESSNRPKQISAAAPAGTRSYAPGHWGLVEVSVVNPGDEPATALTSLLFPGDPNQQYGREMWLPPRSRRTSWYPVFVPHDVPDDTSTLSYRALFIERTRPSEHFIASRHGQMLSDGLLPLHKERTTCWIGEERPGDNDDPFVAVGDTLTAARLGAGLSRRVVQLRGLVLPTSAETLQGLDHLVLTSDRPAGDAAGMEAIRAWVARGGRLWIMLDRVSPSTVERLLGSACRIQTVDRIGLTEVRIDGIGRAAQSAQQQARQYEVPVEMVRVLADNVEIVHTVNGWPASFRHPLGRGEVWFTTLSAEGWTRGRTDSDSRPRSADTDSSKVAEEPLRYLAGELMRPLERATPPPEVWEPFLAEQIGYEITSRGSVLALLGLFCSVLVGGAVWLGHRGRLEGMAWVGPLAAVAAAGVLAGVGLQNTRAVPPTVAEGQFIETVPGAPDVQVTGILMFYNQDSALTETGSAAGGVFLPDMSGFSGEVRRMVWTDWDRWRWENLRLPRGVRIATFQNQMRLDAPLVARASFGPEGLSGRISGPPSELTDLLLTAPSGENLSVRLGADGEFVSGPDQVLPPGKFLTDTLLSDAQRRRQDVYRRLLEPNRRDDPSARPTVFGWSEPLDLGFWYPQEMRRTGSALLAFPLQLERTPAETQVRIPSPFLPYRAVNAPDGAPVSGPLNNRTGEWSEYSGPAEFWLRFQLPAEVLPLETDQADLTLRTTGAVSRLELQGVIEGRPEALHAWEDPVGVLRHSLPGPALHQDESGGLLLGLRVSGAEQLEEEVGGLRQFWRIESLELDVRGRTLPER